MTNPELRQPKYWICNDCAQKRKWKCFKTGNTVIMGLCGWCDSASETMLTPLRDLKNEKGFRADNDEGL